MARRKAGMPPERQSARILAQNRQHEHNTRARRRAEKNAAPSTAADTPKPTRLVILKVPDLQKGIHRSTAVKGTQDVSDTQPEVDASLDDQTDEEEREEEHEYDEPGDDYDPSRALIAPLMVANVKLYTIKDLEEMIDSEYLDLNPEYQRDVVWKISTMSGLIASIIDNYFIPPIIFSKQDVITSQGTIAEKRTCVDGKQRLSSIAAFLSGDIPFTDRAGKIWYYCQKPGNSKAKRSIMHPKDKQIFRQRTLTACEYKDLSSALEEDIFARVQKGVPLSESEKMRATNGKWQQLAKAFETDFPIVADLSAPGRGTRFKRFLASFAQIVELLVPSDKKNGKVRSMISKEALNNFCEKQQSAYSPWFEQFLRRTFLTFQRIAANNPRTFQNNGYKTALKFAPIEFIAVASLISKYQGTRSDGLLITDILAMRAQARAVTQDTSRFTVYWTSFGDFIRDLEHLQGPGDKIEHPAASYAPTACGQQTIPSANDRAGNSTPELRPSSSRSQSSRLSVQPIRGSSNKPNSAVSSRTSLNSTTSKTHVSRPRQRSSSIDSVLGDVGKRPNDSPADANYYLPIHGTIEQTTSRTQTPGERVTPRANTRGTSTETPTSPPDNLKRSISLLSNSCLNSSDLVRKRPKLDELDRPPY